MNRIAFVTSNILKPTPEDGSSSPLYDLACLLAEKFEVSLFFDPKEPIHQLEFETWSRFYKSKNIQLKRITESKIPFTGTPHAIRAYKVYQHLLQENFDLVHFSEGEGLGYYAMLMAQQGLAFHQTSFAVHLQRPTRWLRQKKHLWLRDSEDLELDFLERSSVQYADVVLSSDESLIGWVHEQNWPSRKPIRLMPRPQDSAIEWIEFHNRMENVRLYPPLKGSPQTEVSPQTRVTVCLATKDRPEFLAAALRSLTEQTHPYFSVIVVDDGSSLENQKKNQICLQGFSSRLDIKSRITTGIGPSQARNLAAQESAADFLLFCDDDNLAKPNEIETFLKAQVRTEADIITCALDHFSSRTSSLSKVPLVEHRWIPLGACPALALESNVFGDTNMFVRRQAFLEVGGFSKDVLIGEDWDLLWRLIEKGYRLEVCPEALVYYRQHSENRTLQLKRNHLHLLPEPTRQFLSRQPADVRDRIALSLPFLQAHDVAKSSVATVNSYSPLERNLIQHLLPGHSNEKCRTYHADLKWFSSGLSIQAEEQDSQVILDLNLQPISHPLLEMRIFSRRDSEIQIYYQTLDSFDFSEDRAIYLGLRNGWNDLSIPVPSHQVAGSLRFDFGDLSGSYFIASLNLLSAEKPRTCDLFSQSCEHLQCPLPPETEQTIHWLAWDEIETENIVMQKNESSSLFIKALNKDPILKMRIPQTESARITSWFIELTAPEDTQLEIYFDPRNQHQFSASQVVSTRILRGQNFVRLSLFHPQSIGSWRMDPGFAEGTYEIQRIGYSHGHH